MPVLLPRLEPHDVTCSDLLNGPAPVLHAPTTRGHDQGLAQRVSLPGSAGTKFKGNVLEMRDEG